MRSFISTLTTYRATLNIVTLLTIILLNLAFIKNSTILTGSLWVVYLSIAAYGILHTIQASSKLLKTYYLAFTITVLGLVLKMTGPFGILVFTGHVICSIILAYIIGRALVKGEVKNKILAVLAIGVMLPTILRLFIAIVAPEYLLLFYSFSVILMALFILLEKNNTIKIASLIMLINFAVGLSGQLRSSLQTTGFMELLKY